PLGRACAPGGWVARARLGAAPLADRGVARPAVPLRRELANRGLQDAEASRVRIPLARPFTVGRRCFRLRLGLRLGRFRRHSGSDPAPTLAAALAGDKLERSGGLA